MSKLTALKRQIAALEAQAERLAKAEMATAIAKVKDIMSEFNLTIEHLTETATRNGAATKAKVKGKGKTASAPKYADPKTGRTWTGFGRAPGWLAKAKNRDAYLIGRAPDAEAVATASQAAKNTANKVIKAGNSTKAAAKSAARKATRVSKKAATVAAAPVTAKSKPAAKKSAPERKKADAPRSAAAAKKASAKAAAKKIAPQAVGSASLDAAANPAA